MPTNDKNGIKIWQRRTNRESIFHWLLWLIGIMIFTYCWQQISKSTTWFFVWDAPRIATDLWTRATPPKWEYISQLGKPIWDTLNIATLGTLFALIIAVPVAFLAARNTTPSRFIIRPIALLIIVSTRSINSLIWALLLIAIIGDKHIFIWMDPEVVAHDEIIQGKSSWLNKPWFIVRALIFIGGWSLYRYFSRKFSLAQDLANDNKNFKRNTKKR